MIQDDWYLKRFLLAKNRKVDEAFQMLDQTMRWRNDMYISQVRDYHFPAEFYQIGGLFIYEPDREGTQVLYIRVRLHRQTVEMDEPLKGFVVHNFNKAEKLAQGQGFAIVFDLTGLGYSNLDWGFLTFLIDFGRNHFPGSLKYILVYNLPRILSYLQKGVFAMLPSEALGMIKFARGDEIFKYIAPENCPDYIPGGCCKRNYRKVAPGSRPILDVMTHYGYNKDVYDKIYPTFQKDLEDSAKALQGKEYIDPPAEFYDDMTGIEWVPLPLPSRRVREPIKRPEFEEEVTNNVTSLESTELPSPLTKKLKSLGEPCLSIFPSDQVSFVFDGQSYVADLDLKNITDNLVAYKVLSTNPKNYLVSPFKGILLPRSSLRISISHSSSMASSFPSPKDKFLVVSATVSRQDMTAGEFAQLWKTNRDQVSSHKLRSRIAFATSNEEVCFERLDSINTSYSRYDSMDSSYSTKSSLSQELQQMNDKIRKLDVRYARLLVMFYFLLSLTVLFFGLIVAQVNGYDLVTSSLSSLSPKKLVSSAFNVK